MNHKFNDMDRAILQERKDCSMIVWKARQRAQIKGSPARDLIDWLQEIEQEILNRAMPESSNV